MSSAIFDVRKFLELLENQILIYKSFKVNKPGISFYWSSIGTDEKLFKVPGDVSSPDWLPDEELRVGHQVLGVISRGGKRAL